MGKKRQMDNHDNCSSTDSGQEDSHGQTASANGPVGAAGAGSLGAESPMTSCCQHIKKSVDAARLRRQLKATGLLYECEQCQKISQRQSAASGSGSGGDLASDFEIDSTLWLCLKCGTQLCGRSRKQHALQHYKTPHSDSHALAMNTRTFEIWCYGCDNKVIPNSRKNLLECVELVKRQAQKPPADPPVEATVVATPSPPTITDIEQKFKSTFNRLKPIVPMTGGSFEDNNSTSKSNLTAIPLPPPPGAIGSSPVPGMAKRIDSGAAAGSNPNRPGSPKSELERLPRVRGLTNLGNTCFFNAVMQCLAQTPFLLSVLRELSEPGEEFELPGGTFDFKDKGSYELPIIRGTLSSWGGLTSALANALEELQVGGGVFTPSKLFDRLCAKCPQFTGGDQHDAHELLRQLLESVRNEDLKRYQRVILQNLGYKDQGIHSVSEEMRQKCKIYGNQAGDRILRPEQVFRGFLVSTLTCQDCHSVSSRHEYFLDMSLPVAVEKPQPPQRRRPSPESSPFPIAGQTQAQTQTQNQLLSPNKINTKFTTPEDLNPFTTASSSSFYLHANQQEPVGPSKSQVKKEKERERKAKRAAKHHRYKQAQKLTLQLNGNGTGSQADADSEANNELDAGPGRVATTGGGDGDGQSTSDGQDAPKEDLMSSSTTTSENSDADVEDNLVEETATTRDRNKARGSTGGSPSAAQGGSSRFFTDTNGNAQPLGEKRDDTPENMDKDSLEEDENDSGIATSPLPSGISKMTMTTTTTTAANNNEASRGPEQQQKDKKEEGPASADIVTAGVSEVGASTIRQISIESEPPPNGVDRVEAGEANVDANATLQLQEMATKLSLSDFTLEATAAAAASATAEGVAAAAAAAGVAAAASAAAAAARAKRVRTYSYSDWSTTIAPRYQCEDGECSVQSCLNNFTAVELMTGQNKVGCDSCTQRINGNDTKAKSVNTNATKQLLVSSPPAVLILHLKRFQLGPRCIFRKLTRPVSYPNMLDIAAFCGSKVKNLPNIDRKQKKLLYALYGVVEHSGGMYGGHYTAYVKVRPKVTPEDKRWKFLPHGSKAELDQDDEQLKKLEELLAKEKARELHLNSMNDSDDFTNSSSNSSTSDEFNTNPNGGTGPDGKHEQQEEEAANVQAPPGKWYYVSDSRVQEVSEDTALKAQAYLLFYERIY